MNTIFNVQELSEYNKLTAAVLTENILELCDILFEKHPYTLKHCHRVSYYNPLIRKEISFPCSRVSSPLRIHTTL